MTKYVELLCSLPHLANPFVHRRPPISSVQFGKRMNMLITEDRVLIRQLMATFYWGRIELSSQDDELVKQAGRLMAEIQSKDMLRWLGWGMDFRTIIAALRRRHQGQETAPTEQNWGYGHYVYHIRQNWSHPTFKLEQRFHWLEPALRLLHERDSLNLEKLLLQTAWHYYTSQEAAIAFSFSDVWLYAVKWDLVNRWCSYDHGKAKVQFDNMVATSLKQPLEQLS